MRIWLDQAREEPFRWDETESIAPEELERPELVALGTVSWQGEVVYVDPGYLLRGRLSYDQTLECIRCLKPHVIRSQADVELLLAVESHHQKAKRTPEAEEQELLESDLDTVVVADEVLDTRPLVLEQLQLNLPMKPLCRPDCRGLCPSCGADLNERRGAGCACGRLEADPRWAALAALKGRLDGDRD